MPAAAPTQLIFGSSVEALLNVAKGQMLPATEKKLGALRIGGGHKIEPAYPAQDWATAVKLVSADLYPGLDPDEQHRRLGRATVMQFADTFMGKAMFTAAKVVGARRSLERMTRNLKTGSNFIETKFTVISEHLQELWMNDVSGVPGFYAGLIGAGSEYMQGWADTIDIKHREGPSCLFELKVTR
jgi:uncharacterized protein (TIGR02265 family)